MSDVKIIVSFDDVPAGCYWLRGPWGKAWDIVEISSSPEKERPSFALQFGSETYLWNSDIPAGGWAVSGPLIAPDGEL